ncbi:SH3 domain-containing protein [Thiogranum longum]|uniref:SH3 domain-containing protein n=1 Tax=Thiogranum longum TaxID=1537524 RepID=A0A4R1H976_9GAMM|nr:outer membrane beta-barrel protein [Thiogranum longum]TCK17061.1 SH3 domain-containing protein [Thiogranum longum]
MKSAAYLRTLSSLLFIWIFLLPACASADIFSRLFGDDQPMEVQIADPYIELHTGAGRGYPVFHVEEQGEWIEILKRKTDWFKVRTRKGKQGWVAREQLEHTLTPAGENTEIRDATFEEFSFHRLETGAMGGDFEGADVMTFYGAYSFTPNLSAELSASKLFSPFSDAEMANLGLLIHPFPEWRISPFFTVGTGIIRTNPKTTLVQERDRIDQLAHVGVGVRVYLTRQFMFRAQYKNYLIFQSTDDNQEINEWQAGLSVFF